MAILNNGIPTNITEYPNSFKRQGAFPLEAYSVFYDTYNNDILTKSALDNAKDYAKNNKVAYVGQQLITVSQGTIRLFVIANETGELVEYVKQTDYATKDKGGTVKINPNYGLTIFDGSLRGSTKTGNSYTKADTSCLISKGTLNPLLNNKQDTLVSGTNIKTINGQNILGSGNITISGGEGGSALPPLFVTETDGVASHNAIQIYEYAQQGGQVYFHDCALTNISETYVTFLSTSTEEGIHYEYNIDENGEVDYYERIYADINYVNNKLNDITDPILETSATNKRYVDNAINDVRATAVALNGKTEKFLNKFLIIDDLATTEQLEIVPTEVTSHPNRFYISSLDGLTKVGQFDTNDTNEAYVWVKMDSQDYSYETMCFFDDTKTLIFLSTKDTDTINGSLINPAEDNLAVLITLDKEDSREDSNYWTFTVYTIDLDVETTSAILYLGNDNTFTIENTNKNLFSGPFVLFDPTWDITQKPISIKYLQKSNIENSIGDRSLTQTFDPGYTYVKIANKNPFVNSLGLDLTDTTPMGATGDYAASFGGVSAALGKRSFACGTNTVAKGKYSLASGDNAIAYGNESFTSGYNTLAKGVQTVAFGYENAAIGPQSFVIGRGCIAGGPQSFAGGQMSKTVDTALRSFAFGDHCQAYYNDQFVVGRYNGPLNSNTLFAVGTGTVNSLKTMFEVTDTGAKVNGQYVLRTSDLTTAKSELTNLVDSVNNELSNAKSELTNLVDSVNNKLSKTDTIIKLENMSNVNNLSLNSTVIDNWIFDEDLLKESVIVNTSLNFYSNIDSIDWDTTEGTSLTLDSHSTDPLSMTPPREDNGYRYFILKTPNSLVDNINGDNDFEADIDNQRVLLETKPRALEPNTQYLVFVKQTETAWEFQHIFKYTDAIPWVNTADYKTLIKPNCYVMVHHSQVNQVRGKLNATWYSDDQYTVLENRIKVLEEDLTALIKFFKDSDTDGVLPPFTLGG